jgi:hypothetical protein
MKRTRASSLLPVVVLAAASVTLAACRSVTPAISVDGETISMDDFERDLRDVEAAAERNETLAADTTLVTDGRVTTGFVATWAGQRANDLIVEHELTRRGLSVSDADRAAARQELGEVLNAFEDRFADALVDARARRSVLTQALAPGSPDAINELIASANVTIDPRYGRWDGELASVIGPSPIDVPDGRGPQPIDAGPNPFG